MFLNASLLALCCLSKYCLQKKKCARRFFKNSIYDYPIQKKHLLSGKESCQNLDVVVESLRVKISSKTYFMMIHFSDSIFFSIFVIIQYHECREHDNLVISKKIVTGR